MPVISVREVALHHYANQKLLLVFMQPGCGPCHDIVPELNRLHQAGDVRVLAILTGQDRRPGTVKKSCHTWSFCEK